MLETIWRRCSRCKAPIHTGATYWTCNVSTCNKKRSAMVFCSMDCWDAHLPVAKHREAWAEEHEAPLDAAEGAEPESSETSPPAPRDARPIDRERAGKGVGPMIRRQGQGQNQMQPSESAVSSPSDAPRDILIVASKLRDYVRAAGGMNTSAAVIEVLSDRVRELCDAALRRAAQAGRKTLMDRDFDE